VVQAELALDELAAGSHPVEQLKRIRNVALHGAEIVRQLMVYARTESEVDELVEVSQVVKQIFDLLKVSAPKHTVLEFHLDGHLPAVRANAAQVRRIVMNLVTNASEAIGDTVRQTASMVRCRSVADSATDHTSFGCVSASGAISLLPDLPVEHGFFSC